MKSYFLTGATGVVGSAVVPLLLEEPDTEVCLLIRAGSGDELAARMGELARFWGYAEQPQKLARLKPMRGDATLARFGLPETEYDALAARCTHVIHCAGTVRMNLPIDAARHSAVDSVREILAFARRIAADGRLAKLDVVSTVGIAGKRPGALPERWIADAREYHNSYEQAKSEAEDLVRRALEDEGLPLTLHRPSMVIGDSRDGRVIHFQIFYYLCEFLSGRKTFGLYPDFEAVQLDVIACDTVARAIVTASRDPASAGRIFHLASGPDLAPRIEDLKRSVREAFRAHGLRVPRAVTIPRRWYGRLARLGARIAPSAQRNALATLPIYLDYLADRQGFDNSEFRAWLAGHAMALPPIDEYLPRVLAYYLDRRHPRHA